MAWHVGALGRVEEMPDLEVMMGRQVIKQAQAMSPELIDHNLRLWQARLSPKVESPAACP